MKVIKNEYGNRNQQKKGINECDIKKPNSKSMV